MAEKKSGVSKRRGAGKVLLATTLAGTAATSAMAQSTTTSAGLMSFLKNTKTKVNNSITNVKEKVLTNALIKTVICATWPKTVLKKLKGVGEHSWNKFSGNAKYQNKQEIINDKSEKLTVVEEGEKNIEINNVKKVVEENNSLKPEENNNRVNDVHTIENNTNREVIRKDDLPKTEENYDNDKVNEEKEFSKTFNESQLEMSNIVNENINSSEEFLKFPKADHNNNVKDDKPKSNNLSVDNNSSKDSSSLKKNNIEDIDDIDDIDDILGNQLDDKKQIYEDEEKFEKVIKDLDRIYYEKNKHTEQNSKNEGSKEHFSMVADDSKVIDERAEKDEDEKFKNEYINNSERKNESLANMNGDEQNDLTLFGSSLLNDFEESNTEDLNIAPEIYNIDEGDEEPPANDDIEGYKDPRIDIGSPDLSGIPLDRNNENYDEDKEEVIIGVLNNINEILTAAKEEEKNNSSGSNNTIKEGIKNDNLLIKESYDKDRYVKNNSNVKEMANPNLSIEKEKNKDNEIYTDKFNNSVDEKNSELSQLFNSIENTPIEMSKIVDYGDNYSSLGELDSDEYKFHISPEEKEKFEKDVEDFHNGKNPDFLENYFNVNEDIVDESKNGSNKKIEGNEYNFNVDNQEKIKAENEHTEQSSKIKVISEEKIKENLINENRKKGDPDNKIENHSEKMEGNIKNTEEKNVEDKNDFGSQDTMYKKVKSLVVKSAVGMIGIAGSLLVGSARTFGSWFFLKT